MSRLLLCLLLSIALHAGVGFALRDLHVRSDARVGDPAAMVVQMIELAPAPPSAPPAPLPSAKPVVATQPPAIAIARPKPKEVVLPVRKASLAPSEVIPQQVETAQPPQPAPVISPALASTPSASQQPERARPVSAPVRTAKHEVLVEKPSFVSPPSAPNYPSQARRRNQQGVVLVEVRLDEQGRQRELKLLRSSGVSSLDSAALQAVSGWHFRPEMQDGQGVPSRVQIPIKFALMASR